MRLYSGTSKNFIIDTVQNQIAEKLKNAFFNCYRYHPSDNEIRSWKNSLIRVSTVFEHAGLLDHGVMLEYQLPLSSKRLDCIICGRDDDHNDHAVIIELKQWDKCEHTIGDNEVMTWVGGGKKDVLHPAAQVGGYRQYLMDTHTAFYEGDHPVILNACSYLHNYNCYEDDVIFSNKFKNVLNECPVFTAEDFDKICGFLHQRLQRGEGTEVLNRVEQSRFRPSKKLMDHVGNVIKGLSEYVLLDEQKIVYDKIMAIVRHGYHNKQKQVVIVKGGPGTGKSVIAINIMADLLLQGYNTHYATGSRAFTETLRNVIGRRGAVQFKYFNGYTNAQPGDVDVMICDESHRIRETSNNRFTKKQYRSDLPQIQELLNASKVCVFLLDDDQVVRPGEIGSSDYIRETAEKLKTGIMEHTLEIQFRCAGSEAFVNWVENTLGIRRTANVLWNQSDEDFEFKIFNSPVDLENTIKQKVKEGFSARLTAGFCWKWSDARNDGTLMEDVVIEDFRRPWNAKPEARHLASGIPKATLWAHDSNGINQVGCIYTAQGFEFDYVGVIFGEDLAYDFDSQSWKGDKSKSEDPVVKRSKNQFLNLVKNTYRVLLSRGMKGCYVYFQNKDTERFVRSRIENIEQ